MKRFLFFFMLLFLCNLGWGQTITNYAFTSNTSSTLEDLTSGATSLLIGNQDDAATSVTAIGFDFYYGGVRYTHFSANSNGQMRLHTSSGATAINTSAITTYTASAAILFPMSGDNEINGGIKYKIIGSTPGSRKLVVEWTQFYAYYTDLTNAGNMQVWLDEATGAITYVYGEIYNSYSSTVARGIALSFSNTATTARYVTVSASPTSTASATLTTNTFAAGSGTTTGSPLIANLGTNISNARRAYGFTPSNASAPSSLTFSSIGISSMTLNWTDNASDEIGYVIYYSTDGINYTYATTTAANAISQNITGLSGGTTYYWKVYALRETIGTAVTGTQATSACPSYSGTISVGPTGTFSNLTTATGNLAACGYSGNIILELQSTYSSASETFPITFTSALGSNATKTITIRPATGATGLSITSANTTGTINLNGASYITFDGRPGGSGAKDMIIANTNAGTSYTVQFINDANNNAFNYCKIRSVNNSISSGTIIFSTTTSSNGNDNNTIDNCDIYDGASTPYNAIYASGSTTTTATYNSNNTISNCNIYNFSYLGGSAYGIYLSSGNTDWTITGNSLYQTAIRTKTTGTTDYGMYISNSGNNFTITNNFIGGSSASCGGTAWTVAGSVTNKFVGIYSSPASTGTTSIQGNTINNFDFSTTSGTTTGAGSFCGISISGGNANIGNANGNIIGSSSIDKIKLTATNAALLVGIYTTSTATVNISNNTIYGLTSVGSVAGTGAYLYGISTAGTAAYTINNNIIGSTSVANSMRSGVSGTTTAATYAIGITNAASGAVTISGSTIGNLASYGVNTSTNIRGISSTAGANTITLNTVRDISTPSSNVGTTSTASVIGISMTSTTAPATVSQNSIYGLSNTHATAAVCVTGVNYGGPTTGTNVVARNMVYGLSIVSSSATSDLRGINFASGLAAVQNNVIRLGYDASGAALTSGIPITGLYDVASTANTGMYFNSVYIGGTGVNTVAGATYAFRSDQTTNVRTYQNNIFYNGRSNSTTGGKHYAVRVAGTGVNPTGLTLNYNDYLANGTGAVFGYYGADVANFATWKTNVGQDANSINADPLFVAANAATPNLNLSTGSPCESTGLAVGSITDDYNGASRAGLTPTDIGAYAGFFAPAGVDMKPTAIASPVASGCYSSTETVTVTIQNNAGSIIDFTVNPVTVAVAGTNTAAGYNSSTVINTGTLAIGATLNVNMPATINMTVNGTYSFNATTSVAGDINTGNDALATVSRTVNAMGGTYTVGTTGTYTTLTAAVAAYNASTCLTSPVVFSLIDASYSASETFPITINAHVSASATNTLTIKPASGVNASISGSVASGALIKLNGADYIIIDGSNSGGTDRSLTITNTATTAPSAIWLASLGTSTGCNSNTIKNCNLSTGVQATLGYGVYVGGTTITTATAGADNDNVTIQNNTITNCAVGIYAYGIATGVNDNLNIIGNSITYNSTLAGCIGIQAGYCTGSTITQNMISVTTSGSTSPVAISVETGFVSSAVTRNNIVASTTSATGGWGGRGITISTGTASSALIIANNLISGVNGSNFSSFGNSSSMGIAIGVIGGSSTLTTTTGGVNMYNNTVNMSGSYSYSAACLTADLYIGSGATALDIRNNIFVNALNNTNGSGTASKNYAIYSAAANTAFTNINNNDYYVSGTQGVLGYLGSDRTDLIGIVAGFGGNANSVNADPVFTSTPVILTPTVTTLDGTGVNGLVTVDYSNVSRSNPPDIGALEFTPPSCNIPTALSSASVTNNQATLNWTAASPVPSNGYDIYYSTSATAPDGATTPTTSVGAGIVTYTTPATLIAQTTYYVWLRSNCGAGLTSNWTSSFTFTTLCDALSTLPWTENFDAMGSVGTSIIPSCWKIESPSGTPWASATTAGNTFNDPSSAPNYITCSYSPTSVDKYLITPPFNLTSGASYDFSFKFAGDGSAEWTADAKYNTSPTGTGSTMLGAAFLTSSTTSTSTYTNVSRTFVAPTTGTYYFMVHVNNTITPDFLGFDDFRLALTPTCFPPTVSAAAPISSTTATINWAAASPAPANGYEYEVRLSGAAGSGATGLAATGTTAAGVLTANVSGLTANTTYSVYVRSLCSGVDLSAWSTAGTFTTPCANVSLTYSQGFNTVTIPGCWSQQYVTGTLSFTYPTTGTGTPAPTPQEGTNQVMFNSYSNSGSQTRLVSPPITTTGTPSVDVDFQWYFSTSGGSGSYTTEGVQVQYSTDGTTWTNAGSLIRRYGATTGWTLQSVTLPAGAGNQPTIYVGFLFTSNAGYDSYMDAAVIKPSALMTYTSSTTTQAVTSTVNAGTTSQQVIGIQVVATNNLSPINITKFAINATGTTNVADISNAKLWSTGTSSAFATTTQFGSTIAAPTTANFDITGTMALSQGINYFWLTYDVPTTAINGNVIDAQCTGLTVGGTDYVPTVTDPTGSRTIVNKTISAITITQAATSDVITGATGKDILRVQFNVTGPSTGTLNLNSLKVTSLNISDADIATSGVKLYNTLTSTTFATTSQLGTSQSYAASSATFSGLNYNLPTGNTYIWVAYDIAATATLNNTVDAKIVTNDINVGGTTYPATDQSPAGLRTIKAPLAGVVTVGTAGNYPTLTNTGGIFEVINTCGLSGNLTIKIISDLTEPGTVGLNNITETGAGGYTVTIQPDAAVNRTISGTYAGALIRFSGADRVTVDGSFNSSGQYLTFSNSNASTSNNTIAYSGTSNNNSLKNCKIYSKYRAITTTVADNTLIEGNDIYGDVAGNSNYYQAGVYVSTTSSNTKIRRNTIHDFYYTSTGGWGCYGIYYGAEATTVTEISNNVIYNINADGDPSQIYYAPSGIYISSGGNIQMYYNSINMSGTTLTYTGSRSAAITINTGITLLDIRNNVLTNSQTGNAGNTYGIYSASAATAFSTINYNDYYITGINPMIGYITSDRANLAAWQTATSQDAASLSADPLFTSATNLLPTTGSPLSYAGVNIAAVTTSINNVARTNPSDIGAYQFSICPATSTFAGTGNWSDAARWDNGVPGPCTQAFINGSCSVTTNAMCTDLTINPAHNLTVNAGKTLSISGQFTIKSTAAGTGSYINNGTVVNTSDVKVERYLAASKWHLVSSPITNALSGIYLNIWLRAYNEATNTYGAYITPTTIPMPVCQGFSVWTNSANEVRTYTGTLNDGPIGPISVQLTGAASSGTGWNLVGNPYPSAIDWNAATGWTKTNIGSTIYLWNSTQYATYNGIVGVNGGSQYIPIGQGFFVQATAVGANFSINNNARLHNPVGFMKNEPNDVIRMKVVNNEYSDEAVVMLNADAVDEYDFKIDAAKLRGSTLAPQLYTNKSDTVETAICGYNSIQKVFGKYVYLEPASLTEHTLSYSHTIQGNQVPLLLDRVTQTIIYPNVPYVFTPATGDPVNRFQFIEQSGTGIATQTGQNVMIWESGNKLYISNLGEEILSDVKVFDMDGRLVYEGNQAVTDLNHLSRAMYLVRVTTNKQAVVKKIMIK